MAILVILVCQMSDWEKDDKAWKNQLESEAAAKEKMEIVGTPRLSS